MKYCLIALAMLVSISSFSQSHSKISPRLAKSMELNPDAFLHISILLSDRFDIIGLDNELNERRASTKERVKIVEEKLQQKANTTQPLIIKLLSTSSEADQSYIHPYWITNIIFCKVKPAFISQLANRTDIAYLDLNVELKTSETKKSLNLPMFTSPNGAEPGLKVVNADKLWALGYTGYGRVAYVADTGIDPTHPAFANKTRTNFVPKAQTWYDWLGGDTPYNCGDHGSHCLGTILGLDRLKSDTVGVAFNAQWIGGAVLCGVGTEDNLAGLQWAIDPDKDPGTIDDMPDVINNSWYDPDVNDDCTSGYIDVETALEAAGIASVFSAGNEGPDPQTITPPHNININLVNSFTVAAINGNNSQYLVADFSSRGPSKCGGTGSLQIKPEVAAPGVNVRSCTYNGGYDLKSGTSMAAPHTCGVILLLKEAFPYLSGYELKSAVYNTCTDLGDPGEDNNYGMGLINAWAAYNYLIAKGNVPVDPHKTRDLILINVETEPYHCEKTLTSKAFIENAGSETVTQFELEYTVTNISGDKVKHTTEWTGILLPGEILEYDIPAVLLELGKASILFEIVKVNNTDDERPLNNRVTKISVIVENPIQSANIKGGLGISTCEGTQVQIEGSFNVPSGRVDWYNSVNGAKIGTGSPFLLPPAYDSLTVLMQPVHYASVGPDHFVGNEVEYAGDTLGGLAFTTEYPLILKSVKVFNTSKGIRSIKLYNSQYSKMGEVKQTLFTAGEHIINLDFLISTPGKYYLVLSDDFKSLVLTPDGANYPYKVDNVLTITGSPIPKEFPNAYAYFYDWQIEYDDFCGRVPVKIPFIDSTSIVNAGFAVKDTTEFIPALGGLVSFTDTSQNAIAWNWNFGDGQSSSEQSPDHLYTNPGTYEVSLLVNNNDGCYDTRVKNIFVEMLTSTSNPSFNEYFKLYPNPNNGNFIIQANQKTSYKTEIILYNSIGIEVKRINYPAGVSSYAIDISSMVSGIYWIRLKAGNSSYISSVVKD